MSETRARRPRILIVDDHASVRAGIKALLRDEYDVRECEDGLTAIAELRDVEAPDVILLDLKFLTLAFEVGADDYIVKPVRRAELHARVRSMCRLKEQHESIVRLHADRERLLQMVVHDMRTPLAGIKLLAEASLDHSDPETQSTFQLILDGAEELEALITNTLFVARFTHGNLEARLRSLSVPDLLRRLELNHARLAAQNGIRLRVSAGARRVDADESLLRRLLDNLVTNAMKHSPRGSCVDVTVILEPGMVVFRVADQGPGVSAERREAIFQAYSTSGTTSDAMVNVGLGLTFCRLAAEAHHGRVSVTSSPSGGACFEVRIPDTTPP